MTREQVTQEILQLDYKNLLITLPTSFGKSRVALELLTHRDIKTVLIVVPRNVLKTNWSDEIKKWNKEYLQVTYTTYVSLPKYVGKWDAVIFDECHHLSERCLEALNGFTISNAFLLSATVNKNKRFALKGAFKNLYHYNVDIKEAIESEVLPTPKVYLYPLYLDNTVLQETLIVNPKARGREITIRYKDIWQARKDKNNKYKVLCTQRQYYNEVSNAIEWYKRKAMGGSTVLKNLWLHKCGERLKWLSNAKNSKILEILNMKKVKKERTLTFCNSIEQTEILGKYCINSRHKDSLQNLADFNTHRIKHITAVNMLNEGMNLRDCRIGIYANLNSSETIVKQRLGRILRHKSPIIIIPYFKDTRDEELVKKMMEDYDENSVVIIKSIDEINI